MQAEELTNILVAIPLSSTKPNRDSLAIYEV